MEPRLRPFPAASGQVLGWSRRGAQHYELQVGLDRVATLAWPSAQSALAYAETSAGGWLLACKQGQVRALTAARRATVGRFEFGWEGGILYLPSGETFHWGYNAALGRSEWVENGLILRSTFDVQPGDASGQVTLARGAVQLPTLPLLAVLDRYLMHVLVYAYLIERQSDVLPAAAPRALPRVTMPLGQALR